MQRESITTCCGQTDAQPVPKKKVSNTAETLLFFPSIIAVHDIEIRTQDWNIL